MNIINNITIFLRNRNAERELKTKIKKYLHRKNIVDDSKALALLRSTIALLDEAQTKKTLVAHESTLHSILQSMQTTIEQLQRNDSRFKSKSYTNALRIVIESVAKSSVANRSINSKMTKRTREFIVMIVDDDEREALRNMITKNIMKKMHAKKIRDIAQLNNDDLKIQTKSEEIKNALRKKSKIIQRIVKSITIRVRIFAMRINEVKIKHIDTSNQSSVIKYLQKINARFHSDLIIKKMS
jgi:ribosomal protein S20